MILHKLRNNSKGNKTRNVVARVTPEEEEVLNNKANEYTGGNVSDFIRHAFLNWEPKKQKRQKNVRIRSASSGL